MTASLKKHVFLDDMKHSVNAKYGVQMNKQWPFRAFYFSYSLLLCVWQNDVIINFIPMCGQIGFVSCVFALCLQPQQKWNRSSPEHVMESTDSLKWSLKTVGLRPKQSFVDPVVNIRICIMWGKMSVLSLQFCCVLQNSLCWEEPDLWPKNGNWNGTVTSCLFWRKTCLHTSSTGWTAPIIRATSGSS